MKTHTLKIDVTPFDDLLSGAKTGEVRNDDRGFEVGDTVHLVCADGRTMDRRISHIQRGYGLPEGICVLSYHSAAREQALADLEEIQQAVFGSLGSEPDVYADYDRLCELSRKMREAIRSCSQADELLAAKDARIKELEKYFDKCISNETFLKQDARRVGQIEDLEAKLAAAEKALIAARPYVECYDTREHNAEQDATLTKIDEALGGAQS